MGTSSVSLGKQRRGSSGSAAAARSLLQRTRREKEKNLVHRPLQRFDFTLASLRSHLLSTQASEHQQPSHTSSQPPATAHIKACTCSRCKFNQQKKKKKKNRTDRDALLSLVSSGLLLTTLFCKNQSRFVGCCSPVAPPRGQTWSRALRATTAVARLIYDFCAKQKRRSSPEEVLLHINTLHQPE